MESGNPATHLRIFSAWLGLGGMGWLPWSPVESGQLHLLCLDEVFHQSSCESSPARQSSSHEMMHCTTVPSVGRRTEYGGTILLEVKSLMKYRMVSISFAHLP